MTKFTVLILGSASASPTLNRNPTSQLINISEQYYLVDCGEGTQLRLRANKIKFQRINHVFISHLHGDHYFGLMGLLQSMHLLGRTTALNLYGPPELIKVIEIQLEVAKSTLSYPLIFHATNTEQSEVLYEDEKVVISTIVLKHKIPCTGFLFKEKEKPRKINIEAINKYSIPKYALNRIKKGEDFETKTGEIIRNSLLTFNSLPSFSYAFCSDTSYNEEIIDTIKDVNLLYHEATFTEEHLERAIKTRHSTAREAATIALKSNVNQLIIGHFSNRYTNLDVLLEEAKSIFENTHLAEDNKIFDVSKTQ
ncbi:MAG: ribonuclease Z [Vicingus serpentipes]|nr:ribonuclease Z [Vicingus serpentipes]